FTNSFSIRTGSSRSPSSSIGTSSVISHARRLGIPAVLLGWLVSAPLPAMAEAPHQGVCLALLYPISTNRNPDVSTDVQLSVLYGRVGVLHGFGLNGLVGIQGKEFHGFQFTGLYSQVNGPVGGFRFTGVANYSTAGVRGIQMAGMTNVNKGSMTGFELGGF